jgi:hypothetical protein
MALDDLEKEMDKNDKNDKGLRKTLRVMNMGKCEQETNIVQEYHDCVAKDDPTFQFLMDCIGSSSHPDMIKLNIFSRLDDAAISDLVAKMFRIPTAPGMNIITEVREHTVGILHVGCRNFLHQKTGSLWPWKFNEHVLV